MAKQEQKPTPYVVIEKLAVVPVGAPDDAKPIDAWVVINEHDKDGKIIPFDARSDDQAIKDAIRNKPTRSESKDGPGVEEPPQDEYRDGTFKAMSIRNWKGGLTNRNQTVRQATFAEIS